VATHRYTDVERRTLAVQALGDILQGDPRLANVRRAWLRASSQGDFHAVLRLYKSRLTDALQRLGAPHPDTLVGMILERWKMDSFGIQCLLVPNARTETLTIEYTDRDSREDIRKLFRAALDHARPHETPARRVRQAGVHVRRDVMWLYRHRIATPATSIARLAREYAVETGRTTDARSVVQSGITRAADLLARSASLLA